MSRDNPTGWEPDDEWMLFGPWYPPETRVVEWMRREWIGPWFASRAQIDPQMNVHGLYFRWIDP